MGKVRRKAARGGSGKPDGSAAPSGTGESPQPHSHAQAQTALAVFAMLLGVVAVYIPIPSVKGQNALWGGDFYELHLYRIRFAQAALFGPHPHLPSWYPRELLGTPFWSNVQSFPFIPTRLLLLGLDPLTLFPVATILAAVLAALFTFLFARRLGLSRPAAALAGWTFASAGFFASRIMAGHLPLLEAYPALPLLLWLLERYSGASDRRSRAAWLAGLSLTCTAFALAGHPQIPLYAGVAAVIYAIVRVRGRAALLAVAGMAAGAGCALFVWWPMLLLIGRSTRVLALGTPNNDIAFPYSRLIAFLLPWAQGWPAAVTRTPVVPLAFPNDAYFWDTVCYVGVLPLVACAFLLGRLLLRRRWPTAPFLFLSVLAIAGLLLALPWARAPFAHLPGTILRSPARLLYFTAFGLAMALGVVVDLLLRMRQWWAMAAVIVLVAAHLLDLGNHDRYFVRMVHYTSALSPGEEQIAQAVGEGRIAIDVGLLTPLNRELDDIGMFDSIALAKPYRAILDMAGLSPRLNSQYLDGSELTLRALSTCGVRFVVTNKVFGGPPPTSANPIRIFPVRDPGSRVQFFPAGSARFLSDEQIHRNLRDTHFDLRRWLMLPERSAPQVATPSPAMSAEGGAQIRYLRESEEQFTTDVNAPEAGYLCWLDAWDPGWKATLDGVPVSILPAQDVFMAVRVPAGAHTMRLIYSTPGAAVGAALSITSLIVLAVLVAGSMWLAGSPPE